MDDASILLLSVLLSFCAAVSISADRTYIDTRILLCLIELAADELPSYTRGAFFAIVCAAGGRAFIDSALGAGGHTRRNIEFVFHFRPFNGLYRAPPLDYTF